MNGEADHAPGCVRLRFSQLKSDLPRITVILESLQAIGGVVGVAATPHNGAMLIHYNRLSASSPHFWDMIESVLASNSLELDPRPLGRRQ